MDIFVFQQNDRQQDQSLNNDTFCSLPIVSAQGIIGNEKYPDTGILLNFNDDDYSQGYHQINEIFRSLTHDKTLQPYLSELIIDRLMMVMILVKIYTHSI